MPDRPVDIKRMEAWVARHNTADIPLRVSPAMASVLVGLLTDYCRRLDERHASAKAQADALGIPLATRMHDVGDSHLITPFIDALRAKVGDWERENPMPWVKS